MIDYKLSWISDTSGPSLPDHVDPEAHRLQQLKSEIHQQLIESLDLSRINQMDTETVWHQIRGLVEQANKSRRDLPADLDREKLIDDVMAEVFGIGPLEPLMQDPSVSDILVNDPHTVFVERHGMLELTDVTFADESHLLRVIQRIVAKLGRRIDERSPMVDARLPDGSRVNAVVPPLALDGPALSIRRFGVTPLTMDDLLRNGSIPQPMVDFLAAAVKGRIGMVLSGGTGAGKTTLLNVMSAFVPDRERLVTIEDSAELILQHPHRVRMETRPPNTEGTGEITQRELVRNALRMRPDRIVIGEVRGGEVWDMLQAMNTGHDGSLTTIHANSARDALARLEMMVALTGFDVPVSVVRQYIALGINVIVHVARLQGGIRRVVQISEIVGAEDDKYQLQDLFGFRQTGVSEGIAQGQFYATGNVPQCLDRLTASGQHVAPSLFQKRTLSPADSGSASLGNES